MPKVRIELDKSEVMSIKKISALDNVYVVVQEDMFIITASNSEQFKLFYKKIESTETVETVVNSGLMKASIQPGFLEIEWDPKNVVLKFFNDPNTPPKTSVIVKNKHLTGGDFRRNISTFRQVLLEDSQSSFEGMPLSTITLLCKAAENGVLIKNGVAYIAGQTFICFIKDGISAGFDLALTKDGVVSLNDVNKLKDAKFLVKDNYIFFREKSYCIGVKKARAEVPFDLNILSERAILGKVEVHSEDIVKAIEGVQLSAVKECKFVIIPSKNRVIVGGEQAGLVSVDSPIKQLLGIDRFEIAPSEIVKLKNIFVNTKSNSIDFTVYTGFVVVSVDGVSMILHRGDRIAV